jgi:hypothetical protein
MFVFGIKVGLVFLRLLTKKRDPLMFDGDISIEDALQNQEGSCVNNALF